MLTDICAQGRCSLDEHYPTALAAFFLLSRIALQSGCPIAELHIAKYYCHAFVVIWRSRSDAFLVINQLVMAHQQDVGQWSNNVSMFSSSLPFCHGRKLQGCLYARRSVLTRLGDFLFQGSGCCLKCCPFNLMLVLVPSRRDKHRKTSNLRTTLHDEGEGWAIEQSSTNQNNAIYLPSILYFAEWQLKKCIKQYFTCMGKSTIHCYSFNYFPCIMRCQTMAAVVRMRKLGMKLLKFSPKKRNMILSITSILLDSMAYYDAWYYSRPCLIVVTFERVFLLSLMHFLKRVFHWCTFFIVWIGIVLLVIDKALSTLGVQKFQRSSCLRGFCSHRLQGILQVACGLTKVQQG